MEGQRNSWLNSKLYYTVSIHANLYVWIITVVCKYIVHILTSLWNLLMA